MKNIIVPVAALFAVFTVVAVGLIYYFRFLQHRADAAVMARYQELAEQSGQNQERLNAQLAELTSRLAAVEQLLRSVG
ncbi:hypothetical protein GCM10023194_68520 [Planotetraspora phitsanulokensis]|uniref:Uncharacterized protein n=1 Tax=Planotetraspora phitsanulokensis TaxID=575192 RepID=A0A8J3UIT3_9ACTN|nr:hypothetical protein [Planotetraspora phitsanulokensis]GII39585.1 hypothetical protein Pph01_45880 [Planotetraspora phitsanulokensis]